MPSYSGSPRSLYTAAVACIISFSTLAKSAPSGNSLELKRLKSVLSIRRSCAMARLAYIFPGGICNLKQDLLTSILTCIYISLSQRDCLIGLSLRPRRLQVAICLNKCKDVDAGEHRLGHDLLHCKFMLANEKRTAWSTACQSICLPLKRHARHFTRYPKIYLVPVPGPLPKFSRVCSRKHGPIFLALMPENGVNFVSQICRAERHCHLNFMRLKFLPGASIQPHLAVLEPCLLLYLFNRQHDCLHKGDCSQLTKEQRSSSSKSEQD